MRASTQRINTPRSIAVVFCALSMTAIPVRAATLDIADLVADYNVHSATSAKGTIEFNVRFNSLSGDLGGYDFFSTQLMLTKLFGGSSATLMLNEPMTEDTASIGPAYWLSGAPTSNENASTQAGEYRFSDFVSIAQAITPSPGDIVAHFVVGFEINSADQFGEYEIAQSVNGPNYFKSDIVNTFVNTTAPATFEILLPEPASGLMLCLAGAAVVSVRRRRASRWRASLGRG